MAKTDQIRAPRRDVPRYCPARPLPAYRFVPGRAPHPRLHPDGHSFGVAEPAVDSWSPRDWRDNPEWLYGVDLFNHGYYWEAHEAWESLWRVAPRGSAPGLFLQGLIQLAAALLKLQTNSLPSAKRLADRGTEKLMRVAKQSPALMGLDVRATIHRMSTYFRPLADDVQPSLDAGVPTLRLGNTAWPPGDQQL